MKTAREQIEAALETAKKATQGKWNATSKEIDIGFFMQIPVTLHDVNGPHPQISYHDSQDAKADAEHIATMNPEFTQAFLESWLEMEAALEKPFLCIECKRRMRIEWERVFCPNNQNSCCHGTIELGHTLASARSKLEKVK